LEDARIGMAPLEKSTRYVRFDQKDSTWQIPFYREPKIMASNMLTPIWSHESAFFTYSRQMELMLDLVAKSPPIEQVEVRIHNRSICSVRSGEERRKTETLGGDCLSRDGACTGL
jgi:hypothetical protein